MPIPWGRPVAVDGIEHQRWRALVFRSVGISTGAKVCAAHVMTSINFGRGPTADQRLKGYAFEAATTIGDATGTSERQVRRQLKELETEGFVRLTERFRYGNTGVELMWPRLPTARGAPGVRKRRSQPRDNGRFVQARADTDVRSEGDAPTDVDVRSPERPTGHSRSPRPDICGELDRTSTSANLLEDLTDDLSPGRRPAAREKPPHFTDEEWADYQTGNQHQMAAVIRRAAARAAG